MGEIFRSVHTIKGTTGFLGFKRLEKLAHAGENLLGLLRENKLDASTASDHRACCNCSMACAPFSRPSKQTGNEGIGDDAALIERLDELQHAGEARVRRKTPHHKRPATPSRRKELNHAGANGSAGCGTSRAHLAGRSPRIRATRCAGHRGPHARTGLRCCARAGSSRHRKAANAIAGTAAESTLRVDVALLNRMMNLVGELVLTRNQVLQATAADPNMTLLSRRLDMVTADLRESVMKARMQPVSNVFSKMPRMVRDLSQSLGRRVQPADGGPGDRARQEPARSHQGSAHPRRAQLARSRH